MVIDLKNKKLDILLHYEASFREDWRVLHKLRILVAGFYITLATGLVGWVAKLNTENSIADEKDIYIFLMSALGVTATACLGWFGSSINTLKRFMVQIEKALKMMDEGFYLESDVIIPNKKVNWGNHSVWAWGKGIVASFTISLFYVCAIASI